MGGGFISASHTNSDLPPAESRLSLLYRLSELASGDVVGFQRAVPFGRVWDSVPADSKGRAFGGSRAEPLQECGKHPAKKGLVYSQQPFYTFSLRCLRLASFSAYISASVSLTRNSKSVFCVESVRYTPILAAIR